MQLFRDRYGINLLKDVIFLLIFFPNVLFGPYQFPWPRKKYGLSKNKKRELDQVYAKFRKKKKDFAKPVSSFL